MTDRNHTVFGLIHNQSFRRMVKGTASTDEIRRWSYWIETNDKNRQKAKKATAEIAGFEFKDPEDVDTTGEWDRLRKGIRIENKFTVQNYRRRKTSVKWMYQAAVLILVALVGTGFYMYMLRAQQNTQIKKITQKKTLRTGRNEQKTIEFTDGSKVILNSNSMLTYHIDLLHHKTINVVLKGEAYFVAKKIHPPNEPVFIVHTPDGTIKDIGTKFLVTVRKNHSRVILQGGEVEVNTKISQPDNQSITIKKGELLSFDRSKILMKKSVNSTFYTSWATGFMHFDHTNIQQFAGYVEKQFDVNVKIVDPRLAHIQIDGSIYFKSIEDLVRSVTDVAKIPVYESRDKKTIYIGNMKAITNKVN